jgi:serine/threonine protein kinase
VKISDFGIARHEEHSVTTSSEVVGSCHYIAPEVWRGEVNAPTVDIYALGCS